MFFIFQFYFSNNWIKYKFWKEKICFVQFIFFFFNFKHCFEYNHFQNVSELFVFWIIQKLTFIFVEKIFPQSFTKISTNRDLETTFSFYVKNLTHSIVFFIFIFQLLSLLFLCLFLLTFEKKWTRVIDYLNQSSDNWLSQTITTITNK